MALIAKNHMTREADEIVNSLGTTQPLKNTYYIVIHAFRRWITTIWAFSILNLGYFNSSVLIIVIFPFLWDLYKTPKSLDLSTSEKSVANALLKVTERPILRSRPWPDRLFMLSLLSAGVITSYLANQSLIRVDHTRVILAVLSFLVVGYVSRKSTTRMTFMYDGLDIFTRRIHRQVLPDVCYLFITFLLYASCLGVAWTALRLQGPSDQPVGLFPLFLIDGMFFLCIGLMTAWIPTYHFHLKVRLISNAIKGKRK